MSLTTDPVATVSQATAFADAKGAHKASVRKRQMKLLEGVSEIAPMLESDEQILFAATACSPMSVLEQVTTGWVVYYIRRCLLVFTNKRILHVPTTRSFKWRGSIAEIRYDAIRKAKLRFGTLLIEYGNGTKEKFVYVDRRERKKMRAVLDARVTGQQAAGDTVRRHRCPRCAAPLTPRTASCARCGLAFRNRSEARRLSWFLPGGGYFYTGHPWLGIGDAFAEVYILILMLAMIFSAEDSAGALIGGAVFGILFVIEKVMTVYHANHFLDEFLPVEKGIRPLPGLTEGTLRDG